MRSRRDRVYVTRIGVVSPLGASLGATLAGLGAGRSAVAPRPLTAADGSTTTLPAAAVELDPAAVLGRKGLRYLDRTTLLLLCCLAGDLGDVLEAPDEELPGLVAGTAFGSLTSQITFNAAFVRDGLRGLSPMEFPNVVINTPPSQANARFGLLHSSTTVSSGDAAGLDAIGLAADWIREGRAGRLLAAGCEALDAHHAAALAAAGTLTAGGVVRPFDPAADGTALGEGAAAVLLESASVAKDTDHPGGLEVAGWGSTFEPGPAGLEGAVERALRLALADAEATPDEVTAVVAASDGDREADAAEAAALVRVLGRRAETVPVTAPAAYWGRCGGAGGALAAVVALEALAMAVLPATPGAVTPCAGLNLAAEPAPLPDLGLVLALARGPDPRASAVAFRLG